jgi:hypothetical protein
LPLIEAAGVDLVLSGHNHRYQRTPLINGYYGKSDSLDRKTMVLDPGDGSVKGSGFYKKATYHKTLNNKGANEGTIYAVPGGSGRVSKSKDHPDHPIMIETQKEIGSMIIDVKDNRLDAKYLNGEGEITDEFTIIKGPVEKWPTGCC